MARFQPRSCASLGAIARRYDKGYGHFTTRTNLQLHWVRLIDVPDILQELAEVEMHCMQTSGNNVRNVTADPFAGAAADEIEDPRIFPRSSGNGPRCTRNFPSCRGNSRSVSLLRSMIARRC